MKLVKTINEKLKYFINQSSYLPLIAIVGVMVAVSFFAVISIFSQPVSGSQSILPTEDTRVDMQKPRAQQVLNRAFQFPLKDQDGEEVSKLSYEIQEVEVRDQIIVKGEKATAIKGRTFLIVNLKITNNYDKTIQLNARDYLRLLVNGSAEKLAPDIHNDPVEVQAISTKYTRVGFPINDTDKDITLQIGEIEGKKDLIKLDLQ